MTSPQSPYRVVLPKLGLTMEEAVLVEWHVEDQAWVDEGAPLFAMESEKSLIEIEAPVSGYVSILVSAGESFPVKTPVALISSQPGEQVAEQPQRAASVPREDPPKPQDQPGEEPRKPGSVKASPKARRLAHDRGLSLSDLGAGSGPRGMIVTADLERTAGQPPGDATPLAANMAEEFGVPLGEIPGSGPGGRVTRDDLIAHIRSLIAAGPAPEKAGKPSQALEGLRGIIADRLSASWRERPQVTLFAEIDASRLIASRKGFKADGQQVSYNAHLILAAARALESHPAINHQLVNGELVTREDIQIGLAVDTERGLMVPVVKHPDRKSLLEIQAELTDLVDRTISGKLLPEEYSQGTFTITNLGGFGVDAFSPLINPPETAILGVGKIKTSPVVKDEQVAVGRVLTLSLSFDHRLVDGAPAALFFQTICTLLEGESFYQELNQ